MTVTLDGVDDDIVAVSVTVGDTNGSSVEATVYETEDGFVVDDVDVSSFTDGDVNVAVTVTDFAGNTATTDTSFVLDTSADADADSVTLSIPQTDGIVGFELSGVDVVDTIGIHLNLAGANGNASVDLSVDPADLAEAGLGVLGRAVGVADQLQGLVGQLSSLMPESMVNYPWAGQIELTSRRVPWSR